MNQSPGDPNHPASFLHTDSEQYIAAYLGWTDTHDLRAFVMCWPVLKAYSAYNAFQANLNVKTTITLIHEDEKTYAGVEDAEAKFPAGKDQQLTPYIKARRLACVLLTLEQDIAWFVEHRDPKEHWSLQQAYAAKFKAIISDREFPDDLLAPAVGEEGKVGDAAESTLRHTRSIQLDDIVPPPKLGAAPNESRLESINRLWHLFRFLKYALVGKEWNVKFGQKGLIARSLVNLSFVPQFMIEKQKPRGLDIPKQEDVLRGDELSIKNLKVTWD